MYVLFPGTVILVLASLPVHSLTMVVCVLVVVWGFVLYMCESSIFVGGSMMVIVLRQYFQLSNCAGPVVQLKPGNIIFASCQSISRVSQFYLF